MEQKMMVNGTTLYYETYENKVAKETIILLHGFLSSTFSFRKIVPLLKEEYNLILIDFPPFGKSGKEINFTYSYKNIAKTLILFLQKKGLNTVLAVGHSMGGQIILNMMKENHTIIKKAVFLCSLSYLPASNWKLKFASYLPFIHKYVKHYLAKTGVIGNLNNVVYDTSMIDDTMVQGYTDPFLDERIFRALAKMVRHREGDLSSSDLNKIKTPCLLVWGEHDKVVPVRIGKKLATDLPHADLVILKEAGHLLPEEKPYKVKEHIFNFFQER